MQQRVVHIDRTGTVTISSPNDPATSNAPRVVSLSEAAPLTSAPSLVDGAAEQLLVAGEVIRQLTSALAAARLTASAAQGKLDTLERVGRPSEQELERTVAVLETRLEATRKESGALSGELTELRGYIAAVEENVREEKDEFEKVKMQEMQSRMSSGPVVHINRHGVVHINAQATTSTTSSSSDSAAGTYRVAADDVEADLASLRSLFQQ